MRSLELEFHNDMLNIHYQALKVLGRGFGRLIPCIEKNGGVGAAKRLMGKDTGGITTLYLEGRLDLSIECLVIKDKYNELFSKDEIEFCKDRLTQLGFDTNEEASYGASRAYK